MLTDKKFIDLFSGGGLGARGLVRAGFQPSLAVDTWPTATATYSANFPATTTCNESAANEDFIRWAAKNHVAELLLASPECQSHSIARGSRKRDADSLALGLATIGWVKSFMPNSVIIENVPRMKTWSGTDEIRRALTELGYCLSELKLNAADYGVGQSRRRFFMVGCLSADAPTEEDLKPYLRSPKAAHELLDPEGKWATTPLKNKGRAKSTLGRAEKAIAELGNGEPFLVVYYGSDKSGGWQNLDRPLRTITTLDRFGLVTWKRGEPRLRMLQPSELLRAMSAEDHILPFGTRREKVRLCGNGICSTMTEILGYALAQFSRVKAA